VLWISETKITDQGLEHIAALRNLAVLGIEWNAISDAGLRHIQGMKTLKEGSSD